MADKVTDTDMNPSDPHGVGDSTNRRGEDVIKQEGTEPGRNPNQGTKGESDRPHGTNTARSSTGVEPQDPIDSGMPDMPPGDGGG